MSCPFCPKQCADTSLKSRHTCDRTLAAWSLYPVFGTFRHLISYLWASELKQWRHCVGLWRNSWVMRHRCPLCLRDSDEESLLWSKIVNLGPSSWKITNVTSISPVLLGRSGTLLHWEVGNSIVFTWRGALGSAKSVTCIYLADDATK